MELRVHPKACAILLMVVAGLTGCRTVYVQPDGGSSVQVRLVNRTDRPLLTHHYSGHEKCTGPSDIGGLEAHEERVIRVAADKPSTISLQYLDVHQGMGGLAVSPCLKVFTFQPKFSEVISVELAIEGGQCHLGLTRQINGRVSSAGFIEREYKPPLLLASEGFCRGLTDLEQATLGAR